LSGELNDEQKDNLARVYKSAKHLLALISDVIDISKIEAGRVESFLEKVSLKEIVEEAAASVEPQMKEKGLALELDIPGDVQFTTDRKRLLQCLLNFLSNAVKFTESGKVSVSSRVSDGYVDVAVSDTGIGIPEKDLPKLFEAFERLESHLRVKAGGTGLGLYLTRKLVTDILRGEVSVQSREGEGSTFSLRLPIDTEQVLAVTDKIEGAAA
jgi:signal transduction histidine kinase